MFYKLFSTLLPWFNNEEPGLSIARSELDHRSKLLMVVGLLALASLQLHSLITQLYTPDDPQMTQNTILFGLALLGIALISRWTVRDTDNRIERANQLGQALAFVLISVVCLRMGPERLEGILMWQAMYPMVAAHNSGIKATILYTIAASAVCCLYVVLHWAQLEANPTTLDILAGVLTFIWLISGFASGFRLAADSRSAELAELNDTLEEKVVQRTIELSHKNVELKQANQVKINYLQKYERLYEDAIQGLFHFNYINREMHINESFAQISGYENKDQWETDNSSEKNKWMTEWMAETHDLLAAGNGVLEDVQHQFQIRDNEMKWVSISLTRQMCMVMAAVKD